jgi:hypothetical protein
MAQPQTERRWKRRLDLVPRMALPHIEHSPYWRQAVGFLQDMTKWITVKAKG